MTRSNVQNVVRRKKFATAGIFLKDIRGFLRDRITRDITLFRGSRKYVFSGDTVKFVKQLLLCQKQNLLKRVAFVPKNFSKYSSSCHEQNFQTKKKKKKNKNTVRFVKVFSTNDDTETYPLSNSVLTKIMLHAVEDGNIHRVRSEEKTRSY